MKPRYLFILLMVVLAASLVTLEARVKHEEYYTYEAPFRPEYRDPVADQLGGKEFIYEKFKIAEDFSNLKMIVQLSKTHDNSSRKINTYLVYGNNFRRISIFPNSYFAQSGKLKNGHEFIWGYYSGKIFNDKVLGDTEFGITFGEIPEEKQAGFNLVIMPKKVNIPEILMFFGNIKITQEQINLMLPESATKQNQ